MKKKNEVKIKKTMDQAAAMELLGNLKESMNNGTLCIEYESNFVTLKPTEFVKVEIEATQKKDKQKLSIEFSWKDKPKETKPVSELKISSSEPEVPEEPAKDEESAPVDDSGELSS